VRGVGHRALAKRCRPHRRPAGRPVDHGGPFGDLEAGSHAKSQLSKIAGLLAIDPVDGRQIRADLVVERAIQAGPDEEEDTHCENANHERQDPSVPEGQAGPHAQRADPHARSRLRTNPTPRTV
jgi:hypothetical protein